MDRKYWATNSWPASRAKFKQFHGALYHSNPTRRDASARGGGFVRASPKKPASRANRVTLGVARLSRSVGLLKHPKRKVRHGRRDGRDARARRLKFSPLSHATREQWEAGKVDTRARGRAG